MSFVDCDPQRAAVCECTAEGYMVRSDVQLLRGAAWPLGMFPESFLERGRLADIALDVSFVRAMLAEQGLC